MIDRSASSPTNPFETPRPRGVPVLQATLRVIVSCYCFGVAAARLLQGHLDPAAALLIAADPANPAPLEMTSDLVAYSMVFIGVMTLLRPVHLMLFAVLVHAVCASFGGIVASGDTGGIWGMTAQATRWVMPLALLLIDFWPPRVKASLAMCLASVTLLRLAAIATLVPQGLACLDQCRHGGSLAELVQLAAENGFHREIDADAAQSAIGIIGASLIAFTVVLYSSRRVADLFCVAFGVLLWTLTPLFAFGSSGYVESLLRCSEWGAPLAVGLFQLLAVRRRQDEYVAERLPQRRP